METTLYRVIQEALGNVTRHARATHVQVHLWQEDRLVRCTVQDDGIGFDAPAVLAQRGDRGLGLLGIQERLDVLGGTLEVTSVPGRGTELCITIPIENH